MTPDEARVALGPAWALQWCPDVPYGAHLGGWRATRPRAGGGVPWLRGSRRLELVVEMCAEADAWERAQMTHHWIHVHHIDIRARQLADRHYSRQTPGAREFTPNGQKIVLLQLLPDGTPAAVWASHRPAPGKAVRMDGLDAWACSLFRIEQRTVPASELIREAVAITKHLWGAVMPRDGFYTTINPAKVPPMKRRGRDVWGYSYLKAGWVEAGRTKTRNLLIFLLPLVALEAVMPLAPRVEAEQLPLWEEARRAA